LAHHRPEVAARRGELERASAAYDVALAGFRAVGDEWGACLARLGAARMARRRGDLVGAASLHRDNLERGLDLTVSTLDFVGLPQDLQGLASLASDTDDHELAALLLGTATTLRPAVEPAETDDDRDDRRRAWDRAVAAIGEPAARDAFESGRARAAEDAVHLALGRTTPLTTAAR
jgi:hypothetical protein